MTSLEHDRDALPVPPSHLALVEPPSLGDLAAAIKTEHEAVRNVQKPLLSGRSNPDCRCSKRKAE
jgi:hypothetical protein